MLSGFNLPADTWVLRASEALAGRARTWWDDRCARVRLRTWQQCSEELTREFDGEEVLEGLRADFNRRRQGRTESSVDFPRRQLDVAARLYPTRKDSELIAVLTLGLQPGVPALVQAAHPANFGALLDMAKVAQTENDYRDQRESFGTKFKSCAIRLQVCEQNSASSRRNRETTSAATRAVTTVKITGRTTDSHGTSGRTDAIPNVNIRCNSSGSPLGKPLYRCPRTPRRLPHGQRRKSRETETAPHRGNPHARIRSPQWLRSYSVNSGFRGRSALSERE